MRELLQAFRIQVNDKVFIKDPESSELGKKIIKGSINLMDESGYSNFTFRRLAEKIVSTEASISRSFESKHKLLLYLTSWYWSWMEYKLAFTLANINSPHIRLERAVRLVTGKVQVDGAFAYVDESRLERIIIAEGSKSFLHPSVDKANRDGAFLTYKSLVAQIGNIITEINPDYPYPHMLVSTVIEGAHLQRFFREHLPRLTDKIDGEDSISEFYNEMIFKTIAPKNSKNYGNNQ
jgi:AcrR family transcriptional regulator